jgi:hypothetical protein
MWQRCQEKTQPSSCHDQKKLWLQSGLTVIRDMCVGHARFTTSGPVLENFCVLNTCHHIHAGYPEAKAALDLEALQLQPFYAGARVWFDGGWHTVSTEPAALCCGAWKSGLASRQTQHLVQD